MKIHDVLTLYIYTVAYTKYLTGNIWFPQYRQYCYTFSFPNWCSFTKIWRGKIIIFISAYVSGSQMTGHNQKEGHRAIVGLHYTSKNIIFVDEEDHLKTTGLLNSCHQSRAVLRDIVHRRYLFSFVWKKKEGSFKQKLRNTNQIFKEVNQGVERFSTNVKK